MGDSAGKVVPESAKTLYFNTLRMDVVGFQRSNNESITYAPNFGLQATIPYVQKFLVVAGSPFHYVAERPAF